jgi:hypothetical protein
LQAGSLQRLFDLYIHADRMEKAAKDAKKIVDRSKGVLFL